jgi:NitT/TauT family transport system ATP-binding protein
MSNIISNRLIADNISFLFKDPEGNEKRWKNLNFQVETGSVTSILGASGIGKTTLLKILAGIKHLENGKVFIDTEENIVEQPKSPIFVVFQDYNLTLLPWLSVKKNILLGQYKSGYSISEDNLVEIVKNLFKELKTEIETKIFLDKYPNTLSSGQKQRIQIARALITNAQFILLDEPDSAVDFLTKSTIREVIVYLAKVRKVGVIVITHDIENAIAFSNKIYVLARYNGNAELCEFSVSKSLQNKNSYFEVVEADEFQILKREIINQLDKKENATL